MPWRWSLPDLAAQACAEAGITEELRDKLKYNRRMNHDRIGVSDRIFGFGTPASFWGVILCFEGAPCV